VAAKNAELRQAELVAEVVKPAQAEAERIITLARAQADATKLSAEAAAAEGRIALDQLVIQQLPDMLRAAAEGLQGANLTVLNGADGLSGVVASLAGQGLALLDSVRSGLGGELTAGFTPEQLTNGVRRDEE
jgi:flotillin